MADVFTSPFMDPELPFGVYRDHEGKSCYEIDLGDSLSERGVWHNGWAVTWVLGPWRDRMFATAVQVGDRFFFTPMGSSTMPGYATFDEMRAVAKQLCCEYRENERKAREASRG